MAASNDIRLSCVKWILHRRNDSIRCNVLNNIEVFVSLLQCFFVQPAIVAVLSVWRTMCFPSIIFGIHKKGMRRPMVSSVVLLLPYCIFSGFVLFKKVSGHIIEP